MTATEKERLALDLAVAALAKVQRLAHRQLSPADWLEGKEPDDLATVAEMEDTATKALEAVGRLELADPEEDERPSLSHLPKREGGKVARRLGIRRAGR